ncbi:MAG: DUF2116 family Zn-ribbon domain-containing protein [Massilibacteroides sp.]|nr:DUF2116 family Zn-ribbon domain-containing protein [Massilibacteroides sp.]
MFCINCGNEIKEGTKFCTKCGKSFEQAQPVEVKKKFFTRKKIFLLAGIVAVITIIAFLYYESPKSENIDYDIASAVVNIYCEGETEEESSGGSGTIFSEDGLVLTNAHIIPESAKDDLYVDDTLCLVILPDPDTGSPNEIYYAYPIFAGELSDEYDLAFMQIHDVFYDFEEGIAYGEYPKKFPAYADKNQCADDYVKLGEPIRVYGYPAISGGYALTITDGVVSSLLVDEGLIITSAKISYGNSGGLAVDQNGCMIGIPSMVTGDENESLGIIISNDLLNEFIDQLDLLE